MFHLRVVFGEEPWLARTHGAAWTEYRARVPRWLLSILLLSIFTVDGSAQATQPPWIEARGSYYSVYYQTGFEADAAFAKTWADRAQQLMHDKYDTAPSHYRLSIYLHPAPTSRIDVNSAVIHCCTLAAGSDSTGTIEMLSPSAPAMRNNLAVSSLKMPKNDESYHAKILTSEVIPIGYYEAQNGRSSGGWKFYTAPQWFVQGLEEYDAIFHTTATNRDTTAAHLAAWADTHAGVFSCCAPDITITDAYNGGATFMRFLAVQFGEAVHARLLKSSAPTFEAALTEQTKPYSRAELFARFEEWRRRGALPR
jgi:hypothetical protein